MFHGAVTMFSLTLAVVNSILIFSGLPATSDPRLKLLNIAMALPSMSKLDPPVVTLRMLNPHVYVIPIHTQYPPQQAQSLYHQRYKLLYIHKHIVIMKKDVSQLNLTEAIGYTGQIAKVLSFGRGKRWE